MQLIKCVKWGAIAGPSFLIVFIVMLSGPTELVPLAILVIYKVCSIVICSNFYLLEFFVNILFSILIAGTFVL